VRFGADRIGCAGWLRVWLRTVIGTVAAISPAQWVRFGCGPSGHLYRFLLACPVKGWFRPQDRSETTNDIPAPELA
jgi:hypothetical protein